MAESLVFVSEDLEKMFRGSGDKMKCSSISMTLRYAHLEPDFMAKDIERLDFEARWSLDGHQKEAEN